MKLSHTFEGAYRKVHLDFTGSCMGLLFFCASFTPSLLPRGYVLQGVASGLNFATGYGIGVFVAYCYHRLLRGHAWVMPTIIKRVLLIILGILSLTMLLAGVHWQNEIRKLTEAAAVSDANIIISLLVAIVLAALLIWAARGMHHLGQYFGRKLQHHMPLRVARYGGGVLAAIVIIFLINGVLFRAVFGFINYSFGLANKGTPEGIHQPQSSIYSGSPASAIDWNTLGEKGREFVASGPTKEAISSYNGGANSSQPSRLYVGLESAPTLQERVALLIKELDRTKAADQQALLIAIPTGSGGVNAKSVQSVEYIYGGKTTTLAIQYSYLPSWLSFLADQETARQNGKELTKAVYDWWSHLDVGHRPKLLMYGESLGTLGADGAFSSAADMQQHMDAVLLAGPPNANQLWQNTVADRQSGSPEVLPIYQNGKAVRFSDGVTSFTNNPSASPWDEKRIAIIQHGSDPVVWGGLSLFWEKPDWLKEPRAPDVLPNMRWYPFVSGWQVALDLPFAFNATPGHGHRYGDSLVESWVAVLNAQLPPEKLTQLHKVIDAVKG